MNDQELSDLLASLPREKASPEFTDGVLRRLEVDSRRTPWSGAGPRWLLAALVLLVVGLGGPELWQRHQRQQALERVAALEAEYSALESELSQLRRQAEDARPLVYLGGDDEVELVVDLSRVRPETRAALLRPAVASDRSPAFSEGPRRVY
jgi:hypothetical protein